MRTAAGLDLTGVAFRITGIDVNADAIRMRLMETGDLDAAIVGDRRVTSLPAGSYDVVFSSFVLEHIAGAEQVLDRLIPAIRPGGLLLLRSLIATRLRFRHPAQSVLPPGPVQAAHQGR